MNPRLLLSLVTALFISVLAASAHDHFPAGIVDVDNDGNPDPGEPLQFVGPFYETIVVGGNPTFRQLQFAGPVSGPLRLVHVDDGTDRVFQMMPRPVGQRYGGYYTLDEQTRVLNAFDYFTFIALSDGQFDDEAPLHAATGSWIWLEITSVAGPPGAHFSYWEENESFSATPDLETFPTNTPITGYSTPTGRFMFVLSEGFDDPGEDPLGHIHNRGWTVDKPGDYYVGFTLYDRSHQGPGGGPIHPPGKTCIFHFRAGPDFSPAFAKVPGTGAVLTWASLMGINTTQTGIVFTIQRSTSSALNDWQDIGTVTGTTAATATFTDPAGNGFPRAIYRLKYPWKMP